MRSSMGALMFALGAMAIADGGKSPSQTANLFPMEAPRSRTSSVVSSGRYKRGKAYPEAKARRIAVAQAYNEELRNGTRLP